MRIRRLREAGEFVTRMVNQEIERLMAEREILQNPVGIGRVHLFGSAEAAAALGVFVLEQVAFARAGTHHLAGAGDLEPFGHGFLGLNAFWSSHNQSLKKNAQYRAAAGGAQEVFWVIFVEKQSLRNGQAGLTYCAGMKTLDQLESDVRMLPIEHRKSCAIGWKTCLKTN